MCDFRMIFYCDVSWISNLLENYCKLGTQQYWTVQMKGSSHGSPNMKMNKKKTSNTAREKIGFWGLCVAL